MMHLDYKDIIAELTSWSPTTVSSRSLQFQHNGPVGKLIGSLTGHLVVLFCFCVFFWNLMYYKVGLNVTVGKYVQKHGFNQSLSKCNHFQFFLQKTFNVYFDLNYRINKLHTSQLSILSVFGSFSQEKCLCRLIFLPSIIWDHPYWR